MKRKKRIIFAVTGASGMPLAKAVLKYYAEIPFLEIHLIISPAARSVLTVENSADISEMKNFASIVYEADDFGAAPASGSWRHDGMVICPCSMSSLASIANGCGTNLIHRTADVCLKERRKLVLVTRESPLNRIHIMNMLNVTEAGACVMPFSPAFYTADSSMQGNFKQFAGRILDLLNIPNELCFRWQEQKI